MKITAILIELSKLIQMAYRTSSGTGYACHLFLWDIHRYKSIFRVFSLSNL